MSTQIVPTSGGAIINADGRETQTAMVASKVDAEIRARYALAVMRPRSNLELEQNLLKECERKSFAESALYRVPRGGTHIVGASIRLAETAARLARNIVVESDVIFEDGKQRIIKVSVCDVEANLTYTQDVTVSKTIERRYVKKDDEIISERSNSGNEKVYTIAAPEGELTIKQNALVSKAMRNQILRLIPGDIIESAVEACKKTQTDAAVKDPDAAKKSTLKAFAEIGVTAAELAKYLGHSVDALKPEEVVDLRVIYRSIKDGEAKWTDIVADKDTKSGKPKVTPAEVVVEEAAPLDSVLNGNGNRAKK